MVRLAAALASTGAIVVTLSGCGAGDTPTTSASPSGGSTTAARGSTTAARRSTTAAPAPAPSSSSGGSTSAAPTPATTGSAPPFTTQAPGGKTPLYVVMRMDDISPVDHAQNQVDVIDWFVDHKVKFNFGIIVGPNITDPSTLPYSPYWPTTCQESPSDLYCDDAIVMRVTQAYDNGDILGTGPDAVLEMGNHAYNHDGWGEQWTGFIPNEDWNAWQETDFNNSQTIMTQLYPNARIKYFAAPTNAASAQNLVSMKAHGLEILTAAGTIKGCEADMYWLTAPCDVESTVNGTVAITPQCLPEGGIWATVDGFARVNDIVSAPAGSANSYWSGGAQAGITPDQTVGIGDCGCNQDGSNVWCSVIGSAKNNAYKSNGLHWTVVMMHPETGFGSQSYKAWLDEFYEKITNLDDYTVHFINFQDLARLPAPPPAESTLVV